MKINASSSKENSLYHYTLYLLGLANDDTTSLPSADFIRSVNSWFRRLVFLIWKNTTSWEFDDSNQIDLPIATTTIVNGQQDYSLPSNALDIQRVEVLNSDGDYQVLSQFNKSEIGSIALTEYLETAGMPVYYDLLGNSLMLYPKPSTDDVTASAGLKIYLTRDISEFSITDTATEPGIQVTFHPYLAYGAAIDYSIAKNMSETNRAAYLHREVLKYESDIKEHATRRNKDIKTRIRPKASSPL